MITRHYAESDHEALRDLVADVWPERPAEVFTNRWWWRRSPAPLFIAEDSDSGKLTGMCAYIPFTLRSGGTDHAAAWFVDFFVSRAQQGKGLGKSITVEVMGRFPVTASLMQSDPAWRAFKKLGWSERRFAKLYLQMFPSVQRYWTRRSSSTVKLVSQPFDRELPVEIAAALDALWLSEREAYGAIAVRDSTTLGERYAGWKERSYQLLLAYEGSTLAGYMITRTLPKNSLRSMRRLRIGLVVDYLIRGGRRDIFRLLLSEATDAAVTDGATAMLCMAASDELGQALAAAGYLHSGTPLLGRKLHALDVGFTRYTADATFVDRQPWYLTLGDCDLDLVWGETPLS